MLHVSVIHSFLSTDWILLIKSHVSFDSSSVFYGSQSNPNLFPMCMGLTWVSYLLTYFYFNVIIWQERKQTKTSFYGYIFL